MSMGSYLGRHGLDMNSQDHTLRSRREFKHLDEISCWHKSSNRHLLCSKIQSLRDIINSEWFRTKIADIQHSICRQTGEAGEAVVFWRVEMVDGASGCIAQYAFSYFGSRHEWAFAPQKGGRTCHMWCRLRCPTYICGLFFVYNTYTKRARFCTYKPNLCVFLDISKTFRCNIWQKYLDKALPLFTTRASRSALPVSYINY